MGFYESLFDLFGLALVLQEAVSNRRFITKPREILKSNLSFIENDMTYEKARDTCHSFGGEFHMRDVSEKQAMNLFRSIQTQENKKDRHIWIGVYMKNHKLYWSDAKIYTNTKHLNFSFNKNIFDCSMHCFSAYSKNGYNYINVQMDDCSKKLWSICRIYKGSVWENQAFFPGNQKQLIADERKMLDENIMLNGRYKKKVKNDLTEKANLRIRKALLATTSTTLFFAVKTEKFDSISTTELPGINKTTHETNSDFSEQQEPQSIEEKSRTGHLIIGLGFGIFLSATIVGIYAKRRKIMKMVDQMSLLPNKHGGSETYKYSKTSKATSKLVEEDADEDD